jgi:enamine deaminase RidA (YjgF/YER057c/UK114 family)
MKAIENSARNQWASGIFFMTSILFRDMNERIRVTSGARWEPLVGYCRAIRVGSRIYVTGTTSLDEKGHLVSPGDAYAQTVQVIRNIEAALKRLGAGLEHIVRTRMFVTDISRWEEIGRAHGEFFREFPPATTMVQVSGLIDPGMLIEMEADAEI